MPYAIAKDGVKLHYDLHDFTDPWKKAPLLILQHGFGRSSKFWYSLVPYLSRFYRVACPDLRGLGKSSKDFDLARGITLENYMGDVLAIADAEGAQTFHYAGESLAGMLGMAIAAHHPQRLRTLNLLSASLSIRPDVQKTFAYDYPTWQDALKGMGAKGWGDAQNKSSRFPPDLDPQLKDWYNDEFAKSDVDVLIAMSRVGAKLDVTPLLPKIKVPVLGLYPTGAKFARSGQEAVLVAGIPHMRMVHLPVGYHMVWVLAPATCGKAILHFMAEHDGVVCHEA